CSCRSRVFLRPRKPPRSCCRSRRRHCSRWGVVRKMIVLERAASVPDIEPARVLFREYADSLGVDLEYQGFDEELRDLPGEYSPPAGTLLLAKRDDEVIGCVGVRALDPATAEMKRLYVRPAGRGTGLGRTLAEAAIRFATVSGYERMR